MLEEVVIRNTFLAKFRYKHDNFRFLLFSVLRKISCYGCSDSTTWVLIISYEIALRELRSLKRQAAQGTALVSLACEDAGTEIVHVFRHQGPLLYTIFRRLALLFNDSVGRFW